MDESAEPASKKGKGLRRPLAGIWQVALHFNNIKAILFNAQKNSEKNCLKKNITIFINKLKLYRDITTRNMSRHNFNLLNYCYVT